MFSLIETHAHYNSESLSDLKEKIISANKNDHLMNVVNIGLDYYTSKEVINIATMNKKFYASIGIHPLYEGFVSSLLHLYNTFDNKKIVAIGETGIDANESIDKQIDKMIASIHLANELCLPVIIHANTVKGINISANKLCISLIKRFKPQYGFLFHSFQPNIDDLHEIIKMGGYISIGPMFLKKNADKSLEVVRQIPLDRLLIETDYPYLTDMPSACRLDIFNRICELKRINRYDCMQSLNDNAKRLFYKMNIN